MWDEVKRLRKEVAFVIGVEWDDVTMQSWAGVGDGHDGHDGHDGLCEPG